MQQLNSIDSLWSSTFKLYKERLGTLVKIVLPAAIIVCVLQGVFIGSALHLAMKGGGPAPGYQSIISIINALVLLLATIAVTYSLRHKTDFVESYKGAIKLFPSFLWIVILIIFAFYGGFIMFIIPGIFLAISLVLAPYILVFEGRRGMSALVASRKYVQGHWWAVLGRLLLLGLVAGILEIIFVIIIAVFSFAGGVIGTVLGLMVFAVVYLLFLLPFGIAYYYEIYQNLAALKPELRTAQFTDGKKLIVAAQIVAIVLVILIAIAFIVAASFGLWQRPNMYGGFPFPNSSSTMDTAFLIQIDPTSGPVGTKVTLTGFGFRGTDTVTIDGLTAANLKNILLSNGTSLTFTVPAALGPNCNPNEMCPQFLRNVTPGNYEVGVSVSGTMSNTLPFEVTAK